jgi:hypothetical protein
MHPARSPAPAARWTARRRPDTSSPTPTLARVVRPPARRRVLRLLAGLRPRP